MRVYGKNVVKEYLDKKDVIKKVYIYEKFNDHDILYGCGTAIEWIKSLKIN